MKKQLPNPLAIVHLLALSVVGLCTCQPTEDHAEDVNRLFLPDALANVGSVFQYQIPSIDGNTTQYYITEAGSDRLPSWLQYQSSTHTLQGVPLVQDEGFMYVSLTAQSKTELPHKSITDVFSIDVRLPNAHHKDYSSSLTQALPVTKPQSDVESRPRIECRPDQGRYYGSLIFDVRTDVMKGNDRVTLVQTFANFASKHQDDVRLSARRSSTVSRLLDSNVLAAGPGNINTTEILLGGKTRGVELTWPLACGGFPKLTDFVRVISHNIEVGTISNITGLGVVGWYVTREQPLIRSQKIAYDRRKRQAPMATPVLTPTVTSALPTAYVSTSLIDQTTSSRPEPSRTSMITFNVEPATSTFAPVLATTTDFFLPTTSTPIFTSQMQPSVVVPYESMQFSSLLPSSAFIPISSSYAFQDSSSLHVLSTTFPTVSSSKRPITISSLDTQSHSLQPSSQRLVSTVLVSSSTDFIQRTSSFEMPYFSTTMEGSLPSMFPSVSRTGAAATVTPELDSTAPLFSSISPVAFTTFYPSTTAPLPSLSSLSILLPTASIYPTMQLSSYIPHYSSESILLPTMSYASSITQSKPMMSNEEMSSYVLTTPSSSGIPSSSKALSPTTLIGVTQIPSMSSLITMIVQPSPSSKLKASSTGTFTMPNLDFSSTRLLLPDITRTVDIYSLTPSFTESIASYVQALSTTTTSSEVTITLDISGTRSSFSSKLPSSVQYIFSTLQSSMSTSAIESSIYVPRQSSLKLGSFEFSIPFTTGQMSPSTMHASAQATTALPHISTLLPVTPSASLAASVTTLMPLSPMLSATSALLSRTASAMSATPASFTTTSSSILPVTSTLLAETASTMSATLTYFTTSSPSMLSATSTLLSRTALTISATPAFSTTASPPILPVTSTLLSGTDSTISATLTTFMPASPSTLPATSELLSATESAMPKSSVLYASTSAMKSSSKSSEVVPTSSLHLPDISSPLQTLSSQQQTPTGSRLVSTGVVEPSPSSLVTAPLASSLLASFQPSMLSSMLPSMHLSPILGTSLSFQTLQTLQMTSTHSPSMGTTPSFQTLQTLQVTSTHSPSMGTTLQTLHSLQETSTHSPSMLTLTPSLQPSSDVLLTSLTPVLQTPSFTLVMGSESVLTSYGKPSLTTNPIISSGVGPTQIVSSTSVVFPDESSHFMSQTFISAQASTSLPSTTFNTSLFSPSLTITDSLASLSSSSDSSSLFSSFSISSTVTLLPAFTTAILFPTLSSHELEPSSSSQISILHPSISMSAFSSSSSSSLFSTNLFSSQLAPSHSSIISMSPSASAPSQLMPAFSPFLSSLAPSSLLPSSSPMYPSVTSLPTSAVSQFPSITPSLMQLMSTSSQLLFHSSTLILPAPSLSPTVMPTSTLSLSSVSQLIISSSLNPFVSPSPTSKSIFLPSPSTIVTFTPSFLVKSSSSSYSTSAINSSSPRFITITPSLSLTSLSPDSSSSPVPVYSPSLTPSISSLFPSTTFVASVQSIPVTPILPSGTQTSYQLPTSLTSFLSTSLLPKSTSFSTAPFATVSSSVTSNTPPSFTTTQTHTPTPTTSYLTQPSTSAVTLVTESVAPTRQASSSGVGSRSSSMVNVSPMSSATAVLSVSTVMQSSHVKSQSEFPVESSSMLSTTIPVPSTTLQSTSEQPMLSSDQQVTPSFPSRTSDIIMPTPSLFTMRTSASTTPLLTETPFLTLSYSTNLPPVTSKPESLVPTITATKSSFQTQIPSLSISVSSIAPTHSIIPSIIQTQSIVSSTTEHFVSTSEFSSPSLEPPVTMVPSSKMDVTSSRLLPSTPSPSLSPSITSTVSSSKVVVTSASLMPSTPSPQLTPSPIVTLTPTTLVASVVPTVSSVSGSLPRSVMTSSAQAVSSIVPSSSTVPDATRSTTQPLSSSPVVPVVTSSPVSVKPTPTPVQPSSSIVMSSSVMPMVTTPEPVNQPPILLNPVDEVNANLGQFLHYSIPSNTFYDREDGYTPDLTLSLLDKDHAPVTSASWLQLDVADQVLYGVPLNATITNYDLEFYLAATDSEGLITYDAMVVVIIPSTVIYNHVFEVEIDNSYPNFISDGNNIVKLGTKIANFYDEPNAGALYVDSLVEGSVIMGYSNLTLDIDICDLSLINTLYDRMVYRNGTVKLGFEGFLMPDFPVLYVSKKLQGSCAEFIGTTPAGNVTAVPSGDDQNLVVIIVVPALIIALLLLFCCCIVCFRYKRSRAGEEFLLHEEKPTYAKNRKPIFLDDELTGLEPRKPSRPVVLPDDISPFAASPKPVTPIDRKRPHPPSYQLPDYAKPNYTNPYFDHHNPDELGYPSPKPDLYLVDMSLPKTRLPPPQYSLEPEYSGPPLPGARGNPAMYSPPPVEVHRPPPRYTLPPPYEGDDSGFFPTSHV